MNKKLLDKLRRLVAKREQVILVANNKKVIGLKLLVVGWAVLYLDEDTNVEMLKVTFNQSSLTIPVSKITEVYGKNINHIYANL